MESPRRGFLRRIFGLGGVSAAARHGDRASIDSSQATRATRKVSAQIQQIIESRKEGLSQDALNIRKAPLKSH